MRALDIAGTGMQAQNTNVEVISNNIANLSTTGYKRRRAEFQDLMYQRSASRRIEQFRYRNARAVRRADRTGRENRRDLRDQ